MCLPASCSFIRLLIRSVLRSVLIVLVQCPAGTYGNEEGVCVACKEDHYQDLPGQTYCNKCYLQRTDKIKNNMSKHYCEKREGKVAGKYSLTPFLWYHFKEI